MKLVFLLSTFLLCLSCTTGEKFRGIRQGMGKAEVESRIGAPDDVKQNRFGTLYRYFDRYANSNLDVADYYVIFDSSDTVHVYGRENYRERVRVPYKPIVPSYDNSNDGGSRGVTCESSNLFGTTYTDCRPK